MTNELRQRALTSALGCRRFLVFLADDNELNARVAARGAAAASCLPPLLRRAQARQSFSERVAGPRPRLDRPRQPDRHRIPALERLTLGRVKAKPDPPKSAGHACGYLALPPRRLTPLAATAALAVQTRDTLLWAFVPQKGNKCRLLVQPAIAERWRFAAAAQCKNGAPGSCEALGLEIRTLKPHKGK